MKAHGPILILTTLTAISGCKIQLASTEGGSITTQSGNFMCAAETNCPPVDVSDLDFDETFIGTAEPGYEFTGWRRKQRGLCGGNVEPCRLFTSGFAGNEALMGFLDRDDEVFYLEAVFEEVDDNGGGSGTGDARDCFNRDLVAVDTTIVARYRSTTPEGEVLEVAYDQVITAGGRFNGNNSLKATANVTATGAAPSTSRTVDYFQPQPNLARILQYGVETETFTPQSSNSTVTLEPRRLDRFDLTAGQSYEQTFTTEVETRAMGFTNRSSSTATSRVTFLGIESVTVPAGTFQACRFKDERTGTRISSRTDEWVGVGSGILLKSTEDGGSNVLLSASINGADI